MNSLSILISGVVAALIGLSTWHYTVVSGLEDQIVKLEQKVDECEIRRDNYKSALLDQTAAIVELEVDYSEKEDELQLWKDKPVEVRYVNVYKYLPSKVVIERGDCNDTKNLIDSIRTIDFNKL